MIKNNVEKEEEKKILVSIIFFLFHHLLTLYYTNFNIPDVYQGLFFFRTILTFNDHQKEALRHGGKARKHW